MVWQDPNVTSVRLMPSCSRLEAFCVFVYRDPLLANPVNVCVRDWRPCRFAFALTLAFHFNLTCRVTAQPTSTEQEAAYSLYDAFYLNLLSIKRFDISVEEETSWLGLEGDVEETRASIRVVYDSSPERCLAVRRIHRNQTLQGKSDSEDILVSALVHDGETAFLRLGDGRVIPMARDPGRLAAMAGIPSVHFIGVFKYPAPFAADYQTAMARDFALVRPSDTRRFELDSPSRVRIRDTRLQSTDIVSMDSAELVPLSIAGLFHPSEGEPFVRWEEVYEFDDIDGIRVPTEIHGRARKVKMIDGVRKRGHDTYNVAIRWLSVNNEFDDDVFSAWRIDDENEINALLEDSASAFEE